MGRSDGSAQLRGKVFRSSRNKKYFTKLPKRRAVIVLGMHRSGTSALTRVFNLLGAQLPFDLMHGADNPVGHWESNEIHVLHEKLLASAGTSWHDWRHFNDGWFESPSSRAFKDQILDLLRRNFEASTLFVIKDPRICRFWPVWHRALIEFDAVPAIVMPIRNPIEVAASLKERNHFSSAKSLLLWLRHVLDVEYSTRGQLRAVTSYDALMQDWRVIVRDLCKDLKLKWPKQSAHTELEIEQFISAKYRHHRATSDYLIDNPEVVAWVRDAYSTLFEMIRSPNNPRHLAKLDKIRQDFDRASIFFGAALASNDAELAQRDMTLEGTVKELAVAREEKAYWERRAQEVFTFSTAKIDALNALVIEREDGLATLTKSVTELQESAARREQDNVHLLARLERANTTIDSEDVERKLMSISLAEARKEVAQRATELSVATEALLEAERVIAAQKEINTKGELELNEAKIAIANLADQNEAERALHLCQADDIQRLSQDLESAVSQLVDAQDVIRQMTKERDEASTAIESAKIRTRTIEKELSDKLAEAEINASAAHSDYLSQIDSFQNALSLRDQLIIQLQEQIDLEKLSSHNTSEQFRKHKEQADSVANEHARNYNKLNYELQSTRGFLRSAQSDLQRLAGELDEAMAAKEKVEFDKQNMAKDFDLKMGNAELSASTAFKEAQSRLLALNENLVARDAQIKQLNARLVQEVADRRRGDARESDSKRSVGIMTAQIVDLEARLAKSRREFSYKSRFRLFKRLQRRRMAVKIAESWLFDFEWYEREYPDVTHKGLDAAEHYLEEGYLIGYRPNSLFDSRWYLQTYDDVRHAGVNPLVHYMLIGYREGRNPSIDFETDYYLLNNPDVRLSGIHPLAHYLRQGHREGRLPKRQ